MWSKTASERKRSDAVLIHRGTVQYPIFLIETHLMSQSLCVRHSNFSICYTTVCSMENIYQFIIKLIDAGVSFKLCQLLSSDLDISGCLKKGQLMVQANMQPRPEHVESSTPVKICICYWLWESEYRMLAACCTTYIVDGRLSRLIS